MNEKEVINRLKSVPKAYTYVENVSQSYFSNLIIRYEYGLVKPKTLDKFFGFFGYIKEGGVYIAQFDFTEPKKKRK